MTRWTLDTIPWEEFDRSKVTPRLLSVAKAACMVEHNGYDYARYLCEVFADDPHMQQAARQWAEEEVQHGRVLRRWAELADPSFNFDKSFALFTSAIKLPANVPGSVRGCKSGELIARCIVEIGTSSYYTAIGNQAEEPVLKDICHRIAADEYCHYKLFYGYLKRYLREERLGFWRRLKVALSRIGESEDDELAYAFFAAHQNGEPYNHELYKNRYLACALAFYRRENIERMVAMMFKAIGIRPYRFMQHAVSYIAWRMLKWKQARVASFAAA